MNSDRFECELPVWTIVNTDNLDFYGFGVGSIVVMTSESGPAVPLFTDRDLAERFLDDTGGQANREIRSIESKDHLKEILESHKAIGVTHVGFDVPAGRNERGEIGRLPTIDHVLGAL